MQDGDEVPRSSGTNFCVEGLTLNVTCATLRPLR